ncbi:MAG: RcpC/CpaB family pilus assembly protein [Bacillota bacterium]|jgi:pilus assembly protein CpaB|nr:RcpC/CpaB family pilus assembly protein [Bacillota bacterium]
MKFHFSRRNWPVYLAVFVGLVVALLSWNKLSAETRRAQETVAVVVPVRDVQAYSTLSQEDLMLARIPARAADAYTAKNASEVAGKVTTAPLYRGKPVDVRFLVEPSENAGNYQVVGVNVNAARAAGVKPGDLVDVYWLRPEQGWVPEQSSLLLAQDVRVLRVCDERGTPVGEEPKTVQGAVVSAVGPAREPRIVYLLVKPEDVSKIIAGSADKSSFIALARKSAPSGGENVAQYPQAETTGAGGQAAPQGESPGGGGAGSGGAVKTGG